MRGLTNYLRYLYFDRDRLLKLDQHYSELERDSSVIPEEITGTDEDGNQFAVWDPISPERAAEYKEELNSSYFWQTVLPCQRENDEPEYYDLLAITSHYYAYQETEAPYSTLCEGTGDAITPNFDLIEEYLQRKFCTVGYKGLLYIYKDGQFVQNTGQLEREFQQIMRYSKYTKHKRFKPVCDDMIHRVMTQSNFTEYPFNQSADVVAVKNGVITRKPYHKLLPKSPVWGMTYTLNVNWLPKDKVNPSHVWEFLQSLVEVEDVKPLVQYPASALFNGKHCYKSHMLVGRGANGKSTYLRFLTSFFGDQNISSLSLHEMCNEKFKRAELVGRIMNICGDLPKKPVKNSDEYKKITGRDPVTVDRKYGQPFQFVNSAVMIFAANELPKVEDDSDGWWRRWDIIQFPHQFKVNPSFEDGIMTDANREAFLHMILRAMDEIELYGMSESETMGEIRENWKCQSNSAYGYLRQAVRPDPAGAILYDDLYKNYAAWSEDEGLIVVTKTKFTMEVKRMFGIDKSKRGQRGRQQEIWPGISYADLDVCPEDESQESWGGLKHEV